jgi:hypothetical protein
LAKARHFAEKAEAENRAMTAEEQKAYDEIMAEGREVSDAVKAHCHDQEVFAFARELSDSVIGGLGGDLSGSGIGAKSGQRRSFKHTGASVARPMQPDGMKALAPSGATVVGQEMKPDPVALGQPALSLLDVIPGAATRHHRVRVYAPDGSDQQPCGAAAPTSWRSSTTTPPTAPPRPSTDARKRCAATPSDFRNLIHYRGRSLLHSGALHTLVNAL